MLRTFILATLTAACTPATIGAVDETGSAVPVDTDTDTDTDTEVDTDTTVGGDTGIDTIEGDVYPKACDGIYDQDKLQTLQLDFTDSDWSGIQRACGSYSQAYFPVQFTYEGESFDAMARLRGNWSWSCDKLQFVVSFNEEDPDARFRGLRKVVLDAPWYDHTLMHERLAFTLFEARGLPYSCVNNARVEINGEYYGLYSNVERLDREYLERHFDEPDGNLYQAGTELKTNEEEGDISRQQALAAADTVEEIAALVELDQAVAEWAMEAMVPAMDNYWAGVEINYYLYDHPGRGFLYLPYDLDISFGDAAYADGTLIWPSTVSADPISYEHPGWRKEAIVQRVLADPYWCGRFVEELRAARAVYSPEDLAAQVDVWDAQIRPSLVEDGHKTFSDARHDLAISALKVFFADRAAFVDAWLAEGGRCPSG
jgi:spore coat protein CotH